MQKKVIYISYFPLTKKTERDWYIDYLISKNVDVEYWDLSSLFSRDYIIPEIMNAEYIFKISTYGQLRSMIKKENNLEVSYIILLNFDRSLYKSFRILTQNECRIYFFEWGNFPFKNHFVIKLRDFLRNPSKIYYSVINKIVILISNHFKLIKPFDVVFVAGEASIGMHPKSKQVLINHSDYDNYFSIQDNKEILTDPYCVFLDINLPYNIDSKINNIKPVDASKYFDSLNKFFELIEEKYKIKVIIAGHPKSNYESTLFNGRQIIKDGTHKLVKDCKFVISHHSTSISYAILSHKAIIFIYTTEMANKYKGSVVSQINDLSEYLQAPMCNIDLIHSVDQIPNLQLDSKKYTLYKYNYLCSRDTEQNSTKEIFLKEILNK